MECCKKCGGDKISIQYEPVYALRSFSRPIEGVEQFMRNDSYYYQDQVRTEHLIHKCETCGFRLATKCKDKS